MYRLSFLSLITSVFGFQTEAATFNIDKAASVVYWKGTKKIGGGHSGTVMVKDGTVDLNDNGEITAAVITMDMSTISNEDLKDDPNSQKKLVRHLSSADFFNVSKFPTAVFKLKKIVKKDGENAVVSGDFTMIGKTLPIEFPAKLNVSKNSVSGEASVKIDRTKWGLKYNSGNFFKDLAADRIINDEFELTIKLATAK